MNPGADGQQRGRSPSGREGLSRGQNEWESLLLAGERDHGRRQVDTDNLESELSQSAGRKSSSAGNVKCHRVGNARAKFQAALQGPAMMVRPSLGITLRNL